VTTQPDSALLGNLIVDLCVASEVVDGVVRKITFWLRSIISIANPVSFVGTTNLVPEIWAKAGLPLDETLDLVTLVASSTEGTLYVYELLLSKAP
jgi:hypothetical protein